MTCGSIRTTPLHVVDGNDGGGAITYDINSRVPNWSAQDFPTAQWYHVITTSHLPYHVCGSQQDNSTLCVPSNTNAPGAGFGGIPPVAPYQVGGGEPGYIATHATDPDIFFGGTNNGSFLTRLNRRTGEFKEVGAYPRFFSGEPSTDVKERWQWTYPIVFSHVDPNTLYTSSQRVWKTTNGGDTWEPISGDLTRHDPKTMQDSGGPITHDMNSPEIYGTVFSLAPGKKDVNMLWAGSDDGLIHVTRDHGKTWTNVTPPAMPEFGRVSQIDGSSFDNATAYVAVKKMLLGDRSPYIFRTNDYGKTWTKIVNGIPANDYVHTVREDRGPPRPALRRHAARRLHLLQRRRAAGMTLQQRPARRAGHRSRGRRQRDGDRHARPQLLRPGRHRGAAPVRPGAAHRRGVVQAGQYDARSRSADRHLLPEGAAQAADDRLPRRQGAGGAIRHRHTAAPAGRPRRRLAATMTSRADRRARRWRPASIDSRGT